MEVWENMMTVPNLGAWNDLSESGPMKLIRSSWESIFCRLGTNHDQNPDVANFANFGIVESCWIHLPAYQMHGTSKRTLGSLGMFQSADCNFYSCDLWEHHPWKTQECWGDHSWIGAFSGAALTSFLGLHKEFCGLWGWFVLQTQTCAREVRWKRLWTGRMR